jgi:argininosuccinate synthase
MIKSGFDRALSVLQPSIKVIAPWHMLDKRFHGRNDQIDYAAKAECP